MFIRNWKFSFLFTAFLGVFYDRKDRVLYVFPFPCVGLKIQFGMSRALWAVLNMAVDPVIAKILDDSVCPLSKIESREAMKRRAKILGYEPKDLERGTSHEAIKEGRKQ